ncbi:MAG: hypothetical protein HYY23_06390, partial [Verrucomicrobia bacterium]|nr:hypothetical protein [Verrucomicrobiota bacterium]
MKVKELRNALASWVFVLVLIVAPVSAAQPAGRSLSKSSLPSNVIGVIIGAPSANITSSGPVSYVVSYGTANVLTITLGINDVTLNKTGTAEGVVSVSGSGNTRTVTISGITGDGTLGISIGTGTAVDSLGLLAVAAGPSETFIVDNTPPSVTISAPSSTFTRTGSVTYTATYADDNFLASTLTAANITLNKTGTANGTMAVSGSGPTRTVTISGIIGDGTLSISIASGTATDQAGNLAAAAGPSASFTVDNMAPAVTISSPSTNITASGSVRFTVSYTDANLQSSTLTAGQVTLNKTGTANGTLGVSGSGATRTVTISGITGDGSLGISIAPGTASDRAGNLAGAAGPSGTPTVDNTAPTVAISAPSTTITASSSVSYTVSYADANFQTSTLSVPAVTLNKTGTANGTVSVSGSGSTRTVTITGIIGDGTLGISIAAGTASDRVGNLASAAGPSGTFSVGNTPPTVTISPPSTNLTASGAASYTVIYSDANATTVSLSANDVTLNRTGNPNGTVSVSGSGNTRTVTISGITGDGSLGISIATGTARDQAGNTAPAAGPSETFVVDNTPPTMTISAPSSNFTNGGSVSYTVSYEDVNFLASTLSASDVALESSGTAEGTVSVSSSGVTRTVTISGITGNGTLDISIAPGTATDQAGNLAPAAGPNASFTVDNTPPTVTISPPSTSITKNGPVSYTVGYTDTNFLSSTLSAAKVTLNKTGAANGTVSVSGSGNTRTVTISGITGDGSLGISIASGTASDKAGNSAAAAGPSPTVTVDNAPPTVTISAPSTTVTAGSSVSYTVSYADANFQTSTLNASAVTLNKTGTANGTVNLSGSGTTRTVTITGITGDGTLGISMAAGTASDRVGNLAPAAGPSGTFAVGNTPPTVTISAPSTNMTASAAVSYTVSYSDANATTVSLLASDVTLNKTGTANGTVAVSESGNTRTVTVTSISGDGNLGISIAAGTARDQAGNAAPAAGPSETFVVDNAPPTVTIGAPSGTTTRGGPVTYTVSYADENLLASTLSASDVVLESSGTADGAVSVSGTGATRTVTISNITGEGRLDISIAAGTATDQTGNLAAAAGPSASFTADNTPPGVTLSTPSSTITRSGPVSYTVRYSDANFQASTLSAANVTLIKTGTANGTVAVSGSGTTRTVTISGITGEGSLGIAIASGSASDKAGNSAAAAGPGATFTVDNTAPTVRIGAPSTTVTASSSVRYTVSYADANFQSSTLTAPAVTLNKTGTANGTLSVSGSGSTRTVTISGVTGDGTLGISIAAGTASDRVGNLAPSAGLSRTFAVGNTPPTVTISTPATNGNTVTYTVSYDGANGTTVTLRTNDITLSKTGSANGTVSVSGSGNTRTITLSNLTGDGTLSFSIAAGTATDAAGNRAASAGPSEALTVDNTPPVITISAPSNAFTRNGSITYTVIYADENFLASTLSASDVTLESSGSADGTVSVTGAGTTRTVTISNITGAGTLDISIGFGTATDQTGNLAAAAGPSAAFTVDNTPPTVTVSTPSATIAKSGPVAYTVSYEDANFQSSTLTASQVTLNRTGTANGTVNVSGGGATRTVTISGITGNGTLGISLASGTARDQAGNSAGAAGPSGTFTADNTAPMVTISAPSTAVTASSSVTYTVNYGDANLQASTLSASNVTLNKTGTANGTVAVSGSGSARTVAITGITGDGTLGISIAAATASDRAGNLAPAAGPSGTFAVGNTPPTVTIGPPSIYGNTVTYTVSYDGANGTTVTLNTNDITLNTTGSADGTVRVSGTGNTRTITLSNLTGDGTLSFSIRAGTATDAAGNRAASAGPSEAFVVDNTPPAITISGPSALITARNSVSYTVSYEDTNFLASTLSTADVALETSGTAEGTVSVSGSGATRTVTISGITGNGTVGISVASGTAIDQAGNLAPANGPSATFTVDNTAPTLTISSPSTNITATDSVNYTVRYVDATFQASTLTAGQVTLNRTGTATGTVSVSGTGATRTVRIAGITGNGTLGISVASGTANDRAGNFAEAAGPSETFIVDNTAPTVAISAPSTTITASSSVSYTVNYGDANFQASTLSASNVTLNKTGTANGTVGVSGSGSARTVAITGITGDGTLGISMAAGTASDRVGNLAPAAGPSRTFAVGNTPPTVTISPPSTNGNTVTYTVSYDGASGTTVTLSTNDSALNNT